MTIDPALRQSPLWGKPFSVGCCVGASPHLTLTQLRTDISEEAPAFKMASATLWTELCLSCIKRSARYLYRGGNRQETVS